MYLAVIFELLPLLQRWTKCYNTLLRLITVQLCDRECATPRKGFKEFPWWSSGYVNRKGDPLQGSESGLLSDSGGVPGDTHAEKARDLMGGWGGGAWEQSSMVRGPRNSSATCLAALQF